MGENAAALAASEHFPFRWMPVGRKKMRKDKKPERTT
jgi:hypothetical protein